MRWSSGLQGQPVGGRTSEPHEAPGSDRSCQPPDASGSASRGLARSTTEDPGRGGRGAGLQEATARGGGQGGACGGRAGFGGGCFPPGPDSWSSAVSCRRGGVSWCAEGRLRPEGAKEGRRGAGSQRALPWSSAAAMSAQCCAGQVSKAGLHAGGDGSGDEARSPGANSGLHPKSPAESGAGVDLSGLTPLLLGLVSRARARRSAVGETLSAGGREGKRGSPRGYPEIFGSGLKDFA